MDHNKFRQNQKFHQSVKKDKIFFSKSEDLLYQDNQFDILLSALKLACLQKNRVKDFAIFVKYTDNAQPKNSTFSWAGIVSF